MRYLIIAPLFLAPLFLALLSSLPSVSSASGIEPGTAAPAFTAKNQDGKEIKSTDLKDQYVLLYFYPKDDTPGCTKQACSLRDEFSKFKKAGITVFGVSTQGAKSHEEFKKKHKLPFDLLVDEDGALGEKFGVSKIPVIGMYKRQSVLIGPDGKIAKFMESVDPETHAQEILKAAKPPADVPKPKKDQKAS